MRTTICYIFLSVLLMFFSSSTYAIERDSTRKFQIYIHGLWNPFADNSSGVYGAVFRRAYPSFGIQTKGGHVHQIQLRDLSFDIDRGSFDPSPTPNRDQGYRIGIMTGYTYQYLFRKGKKFRPYAGMGSVLGAYFAENTYDAFCFNRDCIQNTSNITVHHIRVNGVLGLRYEPGKRFFAFLDLRPQFLNFIGFGSRLEDTETGREVRSSRSSTWEGGILRNTSHFGFGIGVEL